MLKGGEALLRVYDANGVSPFLHTCNWVFYMCEKCKVKHENIYNNNLEFYLEKGEEQLNRVKESQFKISYTKHIKKRMYERCISEKEIISAIENGWLIQSYPNEALILSYTKVGQTYRPLHVSIGYTDNTISIVTAYRPDHFPDVWDESFEKQLCFCNDVKKEMY